jgi:hypothetical protein
MVLTLMPRPRSATRSAAAGRQGRGIAPGEEAGTIGAAGIGVGVLARAEKGREVALGVPGCDHGAVSSPVIVDLGQQLVRMSCITLSHQ